MSAHAKREAAHNVAGGSVATTSGLLVAAWDSRIELQIVNTGANPVWLAFQTQRGVAVTALATGAGSAFFLAAGATFRTQAYTGAVYAIATTGASVCTVAEF
jgi:hypothetical protein